MRRRYSLTCLLPLLLSVLFSPTALSQERPAAGDAQFPFDSVRAFHDLITMVEFGPRIPGTPSHDSCARFLRETLTLFADTAFVQVFEDSIPGPGVRTMTNIIGRFRPDATRRILLTTHWDSRPWADADPVDSNRTKPVPGANDGASGTAVLLEIARCLRLSPPGTGVDIVLFDGEDAGTPGARQNWCRGSRYYSRALSPGALPVAAINVDMVGDARLTIRREGYSQEKSPRLLDALFECATSTHSDSFIDKPELAVYDDHVPLQEAGIPAIDLIDFDYTDGDQSFWHTTQDTPAHCAPRSLHTVGTVLLQFLSTSALTFSEEQ